MSCTKSNQLTNKASTASLIILLSSDFIKTVMIAIAIGLPFTYLLVGNWLSSYASRVELTPWFFVAPVLAILLLVFISVGGRTTATALLNLVKSLKSE